MRCATSSCVTPGARTQSRTTWVCRHPQRTLITGLRTAGATSSPLVLGPPDDYNFRDDIEASTRTIVQEQYPQLLDLVNDGCLVVYQRPSTYVERRTDGYQEPELVFVVGTAHVSQRSALAVERVIKAVQPESVVVELCRSRSAILYSPAQGQDNADSQDRSATSSFLSDGDEVMASAGGPMLAGGSARQVANADAGPSGRGESVERNRLLGRQQSDDSRRRASDTSRMMGSNSSGSSNRREVGPVMLSGGSFWEAMARSLRLGGQSALVLQLLLAQLYKNVGGAIGFTPGAEFRAASLSAEAVGAQLVLGDRPIEITLTRAWKALTPQQQWQLVRELLNAGLSKTAYQELTEEKIQQMMSDDFLSASFRLLGQQYPQLLSPLVHERDLYLAWSLKRSKAVNGTNRVVGVVGMGHLRGVVYALTKDKGNLRFKDLVGETDGRQKAAAKVVGRVVWEVLLGIGLYAAWVTLVP